MFNRRLKFLERRDFSLRFSASAEEDTFADHVHKRRDGQLIIQRR